VDPSQRQKEALAAARRAEAPAEILAILEAWDGDFLEIEECADGRYLFTAGTEELPLDPLVGARLGLELDNAGVEFEAELPTSLYSRGGDGQMERETDLSRAAAVVVVQKAPPRKGTQSDDESG